MQIRRQHREQIPRQPIRTGHFATLLFPFSFFLFPLFTLTCAVNVIRLYVNNVNNNNNNNDNNNNNIIIIIIILFRTVCQALQGPKRCFLKILKVFKSESRESRESIYGSSNGI